jgi:hypothetical protein
VCFFGSCTWHYYYVNVEFWANLDLTGQSQGPLAVNSPTSNSLTSLNDAAGEDVFYIGNDRHIHQLQNGSSGWTDLDVTISTSAILPYSTPGLSGLTALSNPLGRQLFFIGTDLNVHRLLIGSAGSDRDWTTLAQGMMLNPCAGLSLTGFTRSTGSGEVESDVFYVGYDSTIHELSEVGTLILTRPPLPSYWFPHLQPDLNVTPDSYDPRALNTCYPT